MTIRQVCFGSLFAFVSAVSGLRHVVSEADESSATMKKGSRPIDAKRRDSDGLTNLELNEQHAPSVVAHDVNNLLLVILASVTETKLRDEGLDLPELDVIAAAAQRAQSCLRRLYASQHVEPSRIQPNTVIRDLEPVFRTLLPEGVELRLDLASDVGDVVIGVECLERILLNLVVNAGEAVRRAGVISIATSNEVAESDMAIEHVAIEVVDNGCGMDSAVKTRALEAGFSTKSRGSGLGLASARTTANSAGGQLAIASRAGSGTVVTVRLPRAP